MKRLVASNLYLSLGLIALLFSGVALVSYSGLTDIVETTTGFSKARGLLENCDRLLADISRQESAERAFLVTGERQYSNLAQTAQASAASDRQQLEAAAGHDPIFRLRFSTLDRLVGDQSLWLARSTEKKLDAAAQSERILQTTRRMEQILSEAGEIRNQQFADLAKQEQTVAFHARGVRSVVLYGGFAATGLAAVLCFLLQNCLKDLTGEGRRTAGSLGEAVDEILNSTRLQAASCTEQATAVTQAQATLQEMSRSGLRMAEQSKEIAERASKAATSGLGALQDTTAAIVAIGEQAGAAAENALSLNDKTLTAREIAATVNEIAQQSHLLALNAAIQAAAAGEQGLAFAAVAIEIKSLADQSREAMQQMRSVLSDIQKSIHSSVLLTEEAVKQVEQGKRQVAAAAGTVRKVDDGIQQSVHAFQLVGVDKNGQQTAIQQVLQAFENIGRAGEQTAAGTRQLERSAINLMTLARQLARVVERY